MPKFLKLFFKGSILVFGLILFMVGIAVFRATLLPKPSLPVPCITDDEDYISDNRGLSKRLSGALKFKTVGFKEHDYNREELAKFVSYISKNFPNIHNSSLVSREVVNKLSLLYYVEGSNKQLKPYLLAGHLDVVPVEEEFWEVPPFSGQIKDGYIWGRGSIDCKHVVMGILEAVEFLLEKGFKPQRSFYLAFGHDEETHGVDGAQQISALLKSRNVKLEYILDEGSFVLNNVFPGAEFPTALVGVSEKGGLNLELSVHDKPGHSSFPKKETPIVILSKALAKLEGDVFPTMFGKGPEVAMFEGLANCGVSFPLKVLFGNLWLFGPVMPMFMTQPLMTALHKTTTAVTIVKGGTKLNVLPSVATAFVNIRIHSAQSVKEASDFIRKVVNDDRVQIKIYSSFEPHPVSPTDTFGFSIVKKSIKQIYNDSCVLPALLIANTDTKWYLDFTKSVYRFSLVRMNVNETGRFHGHNERISIKNYVDVVNFFLHVIKNSDNPEEINKHSHGEL